MNLQELVKLKYLLFHFTKWTSLTAELVREEVQKMIQNEKSFSPLNGKIGQKPIPCFLVWILVHSKCGGLGMLIFKNKTKKPTKPLFQISLQISLIFRMLFLVLTAHKFSISSMLLTVKCCVYIAISTETTLANTFQFFSSLICFSCLSFHSYPWGENTCWCKSFKMVIFNHVLVCVCWWRAVTQPRLAFYSCVVEKWP